MAAAFMGLDRGPVFDEEDPPRCETPHVEACHGMVDRRRCRNSPVPAAVAGDRFHEPLAGSSEHPERTVLPFDDHVLVPVGIGKDRGPTPFPGRAFVARDKDIGSAQGIESGETPFEDIETTPLIERDRQHPFARFQHDGFVQGHSMPEAPRGRPDRLFRIRILTNGRPDAAAPIEHVHALIEDEPETSERISPEITHEDAALSREIRTLRIDHEPGLRPSLAVVIARVDDKKSVGAVSAGNPGGPEPTFGGAVEADRHAIVELVVVILRQRRCVEERRDQGQVGDLFEHLDLKGTDPIGGHGRKGSLGSLLGKDRDPAENDGKEKRGVFHGRVERSA